MAELSKWLATFVGDLMTAQRTNDVAWVNGIREFATALKGSGAQEILARELAPAHLVITSAEGSIEFRFERKTEEALLVRAIVGFDRRFVHTSSKQAAVKFQIQRVVVDQQHKEKQDGE